MKPVTDSQFAIPLSVVMPAYNEEGAIAEAVEEVRQYVLAKVAGAEFIVVDDGSKDRTGQILDALGVTEPRLRVIHQTNAGHGAALRAGLELARGEYVFLLDSDRQIPLEAFAGLWQAAQEHDAALGIRWPRQDPSFRLALSKFVRFLLGVFFRTRLRDANAPFKILCRSVWLEARGLIPEGTITPSLFLAVYMARRGCDFVELPVPHRERATGVVSIRRWKLLKLCARAFRQLLTFQNTLRKGPG